MKQAVFLDFFVFQSPSQRTLEILGIHLADFHSFSPRSLLLFVLQNPTF